MVKDIVGMFANKQGFLWQLVLVCNDDMLYYEEVQ